VALTREFRDVIAELINVDTLHKKLTMSPRIATFERYLPHLGLGLWSRARKWLAR
jgi:hypothetical protein